MKHTFRLVRWQSVGYGAGQRRSCGVFPFRFSFCVPPKTIICQNFVPIRSELSQSCVRATICSHKNRRLSSERFFFLFSVCSSIFDLFSPGCFCFLRRGTCNRRCNVRLGESPGGACVGDPRAQAPPPCTRADWPPGASFLEYEH